MPGEPSTLSPAPLPSSQTPQEPAGWRPEVGEPLPPMTRWGPLPHPSAPDKDAAVGTAVWAPGTEPATTEASGQASLSQRRPSPTPEAPQTQVHPAGGPINTAFPGEIRLFLGGGLPHGLLRAHTRARTPPETSVWTNTSSQRVQDEWTVSACRLPTARTPRPGPRSGLGGPQPRLCPTPTRRGTPLPSPGGWDPRPSHPGVGEAPPGGRGEKLRPETGWGARGAPTQGGAARLALRRGSLPPPGTRSPIQPAEERCADAGSARPRQPPPLKGTLQPQK